MFVFIEKNYMNILDTNKRRLIYIGLWLPVIIAPIAYMFLAYLGEGAFHRNGLWHFAKFIFPFGILFFIHHFLLVDKLFMRDRLKAYFIAVVCLLGAFVIINNLNIIQDFHYDRGKFGNREMHNSPPKEIRHGPPPPQMLHKKHIHGPAPLAMDFCIALLLVGANLSVALFLKYIKEKERNANMEKARLQQELKYLKAQLNPHFFMNMLNNIHGMVEIDPPAAQETIMDLSHLMRYVLYEGAKEYIPLSTETDFITTYITLMRKRYSTKKISIDLRLPPPQQTGKILLPPLLFIVIIENAFKHGVSYLQHSSFFISMDIDSRNIRFFCRNSRFVRPDNKKYSGIGLKNLRKRLDLLYGQNYSLEIDESNETIYIATLTIPYKNETDTMYSHR